MIKKTIIYLACLSMLACSKQKEEQIEQASSSSLFETLEQKHSNKTIEIKQIKPIETKTVSKSFSLKNPQSRSSSITFLNQNDFYMSLVAEVEGFRPTFYNDNIGYAIGFGYNASLQTKKTSSYVASKSLDENKSQLLISMSNNFKSKNNLFVSPIEAGNMTRAINSIAFEPEVKKWIPYFDSLKENEKAVLNYHAYKVGPAGMRKYKTLLSNLNELNRNRTPDNIKKVASSFTYKYKINGETKTDTRSTIYMQAMFIDPELFKSLITNKSNSNLNSIPSINEASIDINNPSTYNDIKDPIGEARSLQEEGMKIKIEQETETRATFARFLGA